MLEQIQLTPFDPNKSPRLVIGSQLCPIPVGGQDESWEGAFIVNANCTRLKESQLRFSLVEAKATALDFAISCCSYWISYCPQEELYSGCSGLLDLLSEPLCDIGNKCLQKIMSKAQNFNFNPIHVAGVTDKIAYCLSRLCGKVSKTEHTPDDNFYYFS